MKKALLVVLLLLVAFAILAGIAALAVGAFGWATGGGVAAKTIVEIDFEGGLPEYAPEDPISQAFLGKTLTVRDVVEGLETAAEDDRVVGLFARVGSGGLGMAQIQEIRDAVLAFRKSGKPAVAFSETFGEFGPGNGGYYLASAFDSIWLQPSGDVGLTGMLYESPFVRGTLDKLGVVPRMDHRYEYKNAMNLYTERHFTPPHREALAKVMNSQFDQMVHGIAEGRHLEEPAVRALFDRGPYLGAKAMEAKLVDGVAYRDEVVADLKHRLGGDPKLLFLSKYVERKGPRHDSGPSIAVIYGVGAVVRGAGGYDPLLGSQSMGSDTVTSAFRSAVEDRDIRAILFRVDSPGGSYVASDSIWREVARARKAGKPVIVSMGDVAGSGGYFVAMGADKIVAQPGTITGSIGVLAGKLLTGGLWDKVGISFDDVQTSANGTMFSALHDYTPQEWDRFQQWLDRIYADFTSKVADGRKLPTSRVLEIAKGRIWSGADAKDLGLVDELGGYPVALRLTKEAAGIGADESVTLVTFPRRRSPLDQIFHRGPDSSEPEAATQLAVRLLEVIRPVARVAQQAGLLSPPGVLSMGPIDSGGPR